MRDEEGASSAAPVAEMSDRGATRCTLRAERKNLRNERAYGGHILFVKSGRSGGILFPMCARLRGSESVAVNERREKRIEATYMLTAGARRFENGPPSAV